MGNSARFSISMWVISALLVLATPPSPPTLQSQTESASDSQFCTDPIAACAAIYDRCECTMHAWECGAGNKAMTLLPKNGLYDMSPSPTASLAAGCGWCH